MSFVTFQNSSKLGLKSENDEETVTGIKIISERLIEPNYKDMRLFYQCLQYTILYFCEENWNEIGESRGQRYTDVDVNFLWMSKYLFDLSTSLVPAIEMMVDKYDLDNGN